MAHSSAPIRKLIVRGTTKMSLNERFTALRQQAAAARRASPPPSKDPKALLYSSPKRPLMAAPFKNSSNLKRSAAMQAALKIKKKTLKQRLGTLERPAPAWPRSLTTNTTFKRQWGHFKRRRPFLHGRRFPGAFRGSARSRGRGYYPSSQRRKPLRRSGPAPTKAELDAQLDTYMSSTKSLLDDTLME